MVLVLLMLTCFGYGAETIDKPSQEQENRMIARDKNIPNTIIADARDELPVLDKDAIMNSLPWIVSTLNLKKHGYKNFQITGYVLSPGKHYAVINISNGRPGETPGPYYRFLVCNPKARRIFYPSMEYLRSEHRDSYIAAKFSGEDLLGIAFGYRTIVANIVSLPEGKVLKHQELVDLFEVDEIEKELSDLLEKNKYAIPQDI